MVNFGFWDERLFPTCKECGGNNSRNHITDHCKKFEEIRKETLKKIGDIIQVNNIETGNNLEEWINRIYFNPDKKWRDKRMIELMETIRSFTTDMIIMKRNGGNNKFLEREIYTNFI